MERPKPKPRPTHRDPAQFVRATRHRLRMELVLEFSTSVSLALARESARRLMEGLALRSSASSLPSEFELASLVCPELRRTARIQLGEE